MISVVIPLYNKEKQIKRTLQSVLTQTFQDFEIVIVNDGSTDSSTIEVEKIKDSRIRLIHQENAGVSAARNKGIEEAKYELIALLDADDEWKNKYLEVQYDLYKKYPKCDIFACNYEFVNEKHDISPTIIKKLSFKENDGILNNYFEVACVSHPPLCSSAIVIKKKAIQAIGGFPLGIKSGEDLLTWAKLATFYQIAYNKLAYAQFNIEGYLLNEKPKRIPAPIDVVGNELLRLLRQQPKPYLRQYLSHWHKMRSSIYMRLSMRKESINEAIVGLKYNPKNYKLYIYILLNLIPSKLRPFKTMLAPIVVFAFNRPNALNNLLTSLKRNHLFEESKLFIFIDGCRNKNDMPQVNEVYAIARKFCNESKENRHIIISQQNRGLGTSIITGVSTIIEKYGKAIVLEDDLTCTPNFLSYINQALDYYEHDKRIFSICGYGLKIKKPIGYSSDVYLSKRSSSWGWATWKDRWEQVDWEIQDWKELVNNKKQQKAFNKNGSDMYSMLKGYMEGKNHSWAIRFCYNQFKLGKYSVCPFLSKINNEGFGENATNCKQTFCRFKTEIDTTNQNIFIFDKNIMPNSQIDRECYKYHSIPIRVYCKIRETLHL